MVAYYKSVMKNLNLSLGFDWSEDLLDCEKNLGLCGLVAAHTVALPAVAVKSSIPRQNPCALRWVSDRAMPCIYLASFTWPLPCWAEQTVDFADIPPALTKKNSYSWPSKKDFALTDDPSWVQGNSAPASQSRIQQHPSCSSTLTFPVWCFGKNTPTQGTSSLFCPELFTPLTSAQGQKASTESETDLNTCLMLSLSLIRGCTQGVALLSSACVTPMAPQGFQKENDM